MAIICLILSSLSSVLFAITAQAEEGLSGMEGDSSVVESAVLEAEARTELLEVDAMRIAQIVRSVARGVLNIQAGEQPSTAQEALIASISHNLAKETELFQAEAQRWKGQREEREELIISIVFNTAKGIATVIAVLVLNAIVREFRRAMAREAATASPPLVVFLATDSEGKAGEVGRMLVEEHLAACGTIASRVRSISRREGRIEDKPEALLVVETIQARLPALIGRVEELHHYAVPNFITLPAFEGHGPDLDWVKTEHRPWWKRLVRVIFPGGR